MKKRKLATHCVQYEEYAGQRWEVPVDSVVDHRDCFECALAPEQKRSATKKADKRRATLRVPGVTHNPKMLTEDEIRRVRVLLCAPSMISAPMVTPLGD